MSNLPAVQTYHASLPAYMRNPEDFADAAALGAMFASKAYPRVSIEGNRFSLILADGTTTPVNQLDPKTGMPFIDVVFIAWRKNVTKTWYAEGYVQGQESEPACFSMDGVRPDAGSAQPQSQMCATCPHNAFGSAANGKGKACGDRQRTVILLAANTPVINNGAGQELAAYAQVFGWSLPPMTGKNLAATVAQTIKHGANPRGVALRATFVSQGVVNFTPLAYIPQDMFERGKALAVSEEALLALGSDPAPVAAAVAPAPVVVAPPPVVVAPAAPAFLAPAAAAPAAPAAPAAEVKAPRPRGRPPAQPAAAAAPVAPAAPLFAAPAASAVIQTPQPTSAEMDSFLSEVLGAPAA